MHWSPKIGLGKQYEFIGIKFNTKTFSRFTTTYV